MSHVILKGPLTLQDVATLVEKAIDAYWKHEPSNGRLIRLGDFYYPYDGFGRNYPELCYSFEYRKSEYEARKKEFQAMVESTIIVDKTRLEDVFKGQTIPPPISEFYIINAPDYVVKILNEAQERINARLIMQQGAVIRIEIK